MSNETIKRITPGFYRYTLSGFSILIRRQDLAAGQKIARWELFGLGVELTTETLREAKAIAQGLINDRIEEIEASRN